LGLLGRGKAVKLAIGHRAPLLWKAHQRNTWRISTKRNKGESSRVRGKPIQRGFRNLILGSPPLSSHSRLIGRVGSLKGDKKKLETVKDGKIN